MSFGRTKLLLSFAFLGFLIGLAMYFVFDWVLAIGVQSVPFFSIIILNAIGVQLLSAFFNIKRFDFFDFFVLFKSLLVKRLKVKRKLLPFLND